MDDKLQKALKKAKKEVEKSGITDLELKKIAFSKAVDFYLQEGGKSSLFQSKTTREEDKSESDFWVVLATAVGIDENKLKDIYSIRDKQILLVMSSVPGELKAERQRNLAALILFAYHEGFEHEWVSSSLLAKAADHSKLYDTSNFAKNIRSKETNWFSMKGTKKALTYKLSGPGVNQAKNLLSIITQ